MLELHYCISGFTQNNGRNSGVLKLAERLHTSGFSHGEESRVFLHPWKADWATIAEHAWLLSQIYKTQLVVGIYAYSWGAGHGAMKLASELKERGVDVYAMVLCDPVPRPCLPIRWTAMLPASVCPPILIPTNVRNVVSLFQRHNLPQGRDIEAESKRATNVRKPIELGCTHQYADDASRFHDEALAAADSVRIQGDRLAAQDSTWSQLEELLEDDAA